MTAAAPFALDARLRTDCHVLGRLALSHLLLHRNATLPWFILVPETDVIELCDLAPAQRQALDGEIDTVCALVRARFRHVTKFNVAAIGNLVPQLHVHVIGRHPDDACWPGVVWGRLEDTRTWPPCQVEDIARDLGLR